MLTCFTPPSNISGSPFLTSIYYNITIPCWFINNTMYIFGDLSIKDKFSEYFYFVNHIKGSKCTITLFACINPLSIINYHYLYECVDGKFFSLTVMFEIMYACTYWIICMYLSYTKMTKDSLHKLHVLCTYWYMKITVLNNHLLYRSTVDMKI